jgi:hypothetical protein
MNLIGSRAALIANICGLVVASVVAVEGSYILSKTVGYVRPSDIFDAFFPAFVMFVMRNSILSWLLLLPFTALAIQMFYQAQLIFYGKYSLGPAGEPLGYLSLFLFVSISCLAIYAVATLIRFTSSFFASDK